MKLKTLRNKIDLVDRHILGLLNKRAGLALEIGMIKAKHKKAVYVPDREKEVYGSITSANKGPLKDEALKAIYREILSSALSLQKPLRISYLGPELTFTHIAAMKKFGASVEYISCDSITDVFDEVEKGRADYGVVPIENSTEGAVTHTLDMFIDSELKICSEIYLDISHNVLSNVKDIKRIKNVYSKDQVFAQCRRWLENNLPRAELIEVSSTAKAAQLASKNKSCAAIASSLAASKYRLRVIAASIEDSKYNVTRFLVIGRNTVSNPTKEDKTSIMVSIRDKVGALHDLLALFKRNKINLTKIESRPSKKRAWDYYFFIDLEGHYEDSNVRRALSRLKNAVSYIKILGSYPVSNDHNKEGIVLNESIG